MATITKVQIVRKRGAWGGYKVRTVTAGGRVMDSYEYQQPDYRRARNFWKAEAAKMGAVFIDLEG